jgi:hypothetical protein
VEETSARYVRVVAVDKTGNKSGPSDAASATALLIDDAHISDLTVSKVTAGTISASWVMAGEIKTADTGARARMSADGYELYNTAGTRTFFADAATGDVSIIGQLLSGTTGKRLEINPTGTFLPEIRFYPTSGTDFGFINGVSSGSDVNVGVSSSPYDDGGVACTSRVYLTTAAARLEVIRTDNQERRGGFVLAQPGAFSSGYQRGGVDGGKFYGDEVQATVGWDNGTDATANYMLFFSNRTVHVGRWADFAAPGSIDGIFTGTVAGTASASSLSLGYGVTMDTQLVPIVSVRDAPAVANTRGFCISASDTTGFTTQLSGAADGGWSVYFWCYRI